MNRSDPTPMSSQQYRSGLMIRVFVGAALMVIAVVIGLVLADADAAPGTLSHWADTESFAGLTRGLWLVVIAAVIDMVLFTQWTVSASRRTAAQREANEQS